MDIDIAEIVEEIRGHNHMHRLWTLLEEEEDNACEGVDHGNLSNGQQFNFNFILATEIDNEVEVTTDDVLSEEGSDEVQLDTTIDNVGLKRQKNSDDDDTSPRKRSQISNVPAAAVFSGIFDNEPEANLCGQEDMPATVIYEEQNAQTQTYFLSDDSGDETTETFQSNANAMDNSNLLSNDGQSTMHNSSAGIDSVSTSGFGPDIIGDSASDSFQLSGTDTSVQISETISQASSGLDLVNTFFQLEAAEIGLKNLKKKLVTGSVSSEEYEERINSLIGSLKSSVSAGLVQPSASFVIVEGNAIIVEANIGEGDSTIEANANVEAYTIVEANANGTVEVNANGTVEVNANGTVEVNGNVDVEDNAIVKINSGGMEFQFSQQQLKNANEKERNGRWDQTGAALILLNACPLEYGEQGISLTGKAPGSAALKPQILEVIYYILDSMKKGKGDVYDSQELTKEEKESIKKSIRCKFQTINRNLRKAQNT